MEVVNFLAGFWGLSLVIIGLAFLLNQKYMNKVIEYAEHEATMVLTGIIGTMAGIFLVMLYNVWVWNWQGLVTLLGWAVLLKGILRLFFPAFVLNVLAKYKQKTTWMPYTFLGMIIIGCYLVYSGFSM